MSTVISKDNSKLVIKEYEVREIDQYGDVVNVDHFGNKDEAMKNARDCVEVWGSVASVVEEHISKFPAFLYTEPNKYTTLACFGNKEALAAGGWQ